MEAPHLSREDRLRKINDVLRAYDLTHWTDARLGDIAKDECEIVDLIDAREIGPRRIELALRLATPMGEEHEVRVRVGGRVVYAVPLLTFPAGNEAQAGPQVCLVKRWRVETAKNAVGLPTDGWSYELPHGLVYEPEWSEPLDPLCSPSHQIVQRAFGPTFVDALSAARVVHIRDLLMKGEVVPAQSFLLAANVTGELRRRSGDGAAVFLRWRQVMALIDKGVIADGHTVAILQSANRKFGRAKW